jgi:hypothetical protein
MEEEKLGPNGQLSAWTPRPLLAAVTSVIAHGGPTVLAIAVAVLCSRLFPRPDGAGAFVWWIGIVAVGALVLAALQPVGRRTLALAGLLRLAIEFPTPPPSRAVIAWRSSDPAVVRRQLERVHTQERLAPVQTNLAVLAATLGVLEDHRRHAEVIFRVGDDDVAAHVVESDIPGFFQVVPIGSNSRKVLVAVVASTAVAALAASAALGSGSTGNDTIPTASQVGPPSASVDRPPTPSTSSPPSSGEPDETVPATSSPRAEAPAADAAGTPPAGGPAATTPTVNASSGGTGSPATSAAGSGRSAAPTGSGAGTAPTLSNAGGDVQLAAGGPTAFAATTFAVPEVLLIVPEVAAPSPVTPSVVAPSAAVARIAAPATDDTTTTADGVAAFAPAPAFVTVTPVETTAADDATTVAPEKPAPGDTTAPPDETGHSADDPAVAAPTAPSPEAAAGSPATAVDAPPEPSATPPGYGTDDPPEQPATISP